MGLGIRTRLRRWRDGPYVNDEYVEASVLGALLRAPAGTRLDAPAAGSPLHVALVVPFFQRGSGGHMTIANLVRGLERRGHRCSLWIDDPGRRLGPDGARAAADLRSWFGPFAAPVAYGLDGFGDADVAVATGWQTAARVRTLPAAGRAYLVQDHEPEFFGTSVQRRWAEASYRQGLYPITAGQWLAEVMATTYDLPATPFDLGIDGERWRPRADIRRREDVVVAYARSTTPRRAVPIVLAALAELHRRRPSVQAWLYGHGGPAGVDFPHRNLGVVPEAALPRIYAEATVGLVLSLTNHSLAAQEMLSCGLPCVEHDHPSVVAAFGRDGPVDYAPLDPFAIADALERLLADPRLRAERVAQGAALRVERTWDHAAEQVEAGLWAAIAFRPGGEG
ncbi:glycosyltransferase family 4 protein [Baekduia soli]|uniref:Glycosyltransferase family 4 protein n=1 Tax=Baekduia soli TaxID=496014 RepID=A0A5B8TZS3_9ACTN|nr:glycosyltransferase family 4 protein [Baekduia soli]QEC46223.1 glycosyltransferase family 4 protein [Baekduia soli]